MATICSNPIATCLGSQRSSTLTISNSCSSAGILKSVELILTVAVVSVDSTRVTSTSLSHERNSAMSFGPPGSLDSDSPLLIKISTTGELINRPPSSLRIAPTSGLASHSGVNALLFTTISSISTMPFQFSVTSAGTPPPCPPPELDICCVTSRMIVFLSFKMPTSFFRTATVLVVTSASMLALDFLISSLIIV